MQQTRIEQGLPYYLQFQETFPTVSDLALADEDQVLRLWQGLGYYSRARNLHATAKYIHENRNGAFPSTYADIIRLKGVGPYTAAAISSICFKESRPVVDGNVFRFASRFFGINEDISKSGTRKVFENYLANVISTDNPGKFNQAMMEFGATVCSPSPKCEGCLFVRECFSFNHKIQHKLPVKTQKVRIRDRYFHYLVIHDGETFLFNQRLEKDVWNKLYDFFLYEGNLSKEELLRKAEKRIGRLQQVEISGEVIHMLSHQRIHALFYRIHVSTDELVRISKTLDLRLFSKQEILSLPKPKLIVNYLNRIGINT